MVNERARVVLLGADCIDDCGFCVRTGPLRRRIAAPSTLGTRLRSFTFGAHAAAGCSRSH